MSSVPQSLVFALASTSTDAAPEGTADDTSSCEFDVDWENIWHCGKRLLGAKRLIGTKIKESWIYQYGANLEHKGVRYWFFRFCHEKRSYSTALYASSGTAHAARHLLRQHQIAELGDSNPSLTTIYLGNHINILFCTFLCRDKLVYAFSSPLPSMKGDGKLIAWTG